MSDTGISPLAARCARVERAAQETLHWIAAYPDRVGAQRPALEKLFRLAAVEARKLQAATTRPTAIGVYGLSQAGKSYLISTLARPPGRQLVVELDRPRPFLAEINPESQKEATGLVTRFTMRRERGPEGFPVRLRLLGETELVMILANSWYCDARDPQAANTLGPDDIAAALDAAEAEAGRAGGEVTAEDIWELETYFRNEFRRFGADRSFSDQFWNRAAAVLPCLPLERRVAFYALLWNRYAPFTEVLLRLARHLQALQFDRVAWAPIEALVPKTDSVLRVDTLERLEATDGPRIELVSGRGGRCRLLRPELTAMIAELELPMSERPWPLLQEADLLDFPGARERKGMDIAAEVAAYPARLGEFFLRGKVAFLFERYAAERELNALLLCIKESNNPYDATIRQALRNWIARTHGERPEDRARVATSLFVVLTRMDVHFDRTGGRDPRAPSGDLWEARIKASLQQPLQESDGWLDAWHPGRAFDNVLLARNPTRSQSLSTLDEAEREVAFLPGVEERIARWGAEFAAHPDVRRYVREPLRCWQEVFRLEDAGMSYLIERLEPVCNGALKLAQIENQLALLQEAMRRRIAEWYVSGDMQTQYARRKAALQPALEALVELGNAERFGLLLTQFHLEPDEAREVLLRVGADPEPALGTDRQRGGAVSGILALIEDDDTLQPIIQRRDPARERAEALFGAWVAKVRRFAAEETLRAWFGFTAPEADAVVAELVAAALRGGVVARLALALRGRGRIERFDLAARGHAMAAAQVINEHVNFVGFRTDGKPAPDRPSLGKGAGPVFAAPPPIAELREIDEEPPPYGPLFCISWIKALAEATRRNVFDRGDGTLLDQAQNEAVGKILELIRDE
ncbi:conserved protein of unknown function [Rhodovastum atsumiense]|uniref:Virulence factor n=1 Tax=Rhodovastum atsumiense TaxID=504468 RepID=A0A5M6IPG4_9PROT|nr:virulence factor SrfC family protein [Rhodovastum atsumiense]KAA5609458.1 hypothetical protein F1189_24135 [Rhodovastum atsumiense]CAH2603540.1 conserved protein of unknown function [Rhodovastum atsumiense]